MIKLCKWGSSEDDYIKKQIRDVFIDSVGAVFGIAAYIVFDKIKEVILKKMLRSQ